VTGASDSSAVVTGASDPLTAPIKSSNLLGGSGQTFLHGGGTTDQTGGSVGSTESGLENLVGGGSQLTTDLTNFGNVISSLSQGSSDPSQGSGSQTTPEALGIGVVGQLDNSGKPEFKDLLPKDPSHSGGT